MPTPYNSDGTGRGELVATWAKIPWIFRLGSNYEMSKLQGFIMEDERVIAIASGRYGGGRGLITLTNRRILFSYHGYVRSSSEDLPLKNVTSIQWTHSLIKGKIVIAAAGNEIEIGAVYYGGGNFVKEARRYVEKTRAEAKASESAQHFAQPQQQRSSAPADIEHRLTTLASLLQRNLITQEEYNKQRTDILGLI